MSASEAQTSSNLSSDANPPTLPPVVGADGRVECPICCERVGAGVAGLANLERHMKSERCARLAKKNKENGQKTRQQNLVKSYFTAPPKVSSLVNQPARIRSTTTTLSRSSGSFLTSQSQPSTSQTISNHPDTPTLDISYSNSMPEMAGTSCKLGIACLAKFEARIKALECDPTVPEAGSNHELVAFSADPEGSVQADEDPWEQWDGPLNTLFQRAPSELHKLVVCGPRGLIGLHRLLKFLVVKHGVSGCLIEGKIERLMTAMDEVSPRTTILESQNATSHPSDVAGLRPIVVDDDSNTTGGTELETVVDLDAIESDDGIASSLHPEPSMITPRNEVASASGTRSLKKTFAHLCPGFHVEVPPESTPYLDYPFAYHKEIGDPWDIIISGGKLYLQSRGCPKMIRGSKTPSICNECKRLPESRQVIGILNRMRNGVSEYAPFAYHGVGGLIHIARNKTNRVVALRLCSLNDAQKIVAKSGALDDHKEWVMAVGSGKVERVERLVRNAIAQKRGIRGIAKLYANADQAVHPTRKYTDDDRTRALLLWRLGGARVAEISHQALGLPSLRTVRRMAVMPPLIASPGHPTVAEVEHNAQACLSVISELLVSSGNVIHQVLMFDEIKIEERVRWDEKTNSIAGICREHGENASLNYTSKQEANLLFQKVLNNEVHLANNATIGAIGILSDEHRLYSALPVLISGQCGRETGKKHAVVLGNVINGARVSKLRTVCLASDRESRRGEAFIILTFKYSLQPTSPLYALLASLPWMNLEVGEDDLTCDKDYRHVFKRGRNLTIRVRGFKVHGIHITSSVIRSHLLKNGCSLSHVNSLLKPEDKQDVKLAYDLLTEITSLPSISETSQRGPGF